MSASECNPFQPSAVVFQMFCIGATQLRLAHLSSSSNVALTIST